MDPSLQRMSEIWTNLYADKDLAILNQLIRHLQETKPSMPIPDYREYWYKEAAVYALYVDLFAGNFSNLTQQLIYFEDLEINCLWLLPILESPMKDQGFDISNYYSIRHDLCSGSDSLSEFSTFVQQAHQRGIKIIFDIAINHTSDQHPWFLEAKKDEPNPKHSFYLWSRDGHEFAEAPVLFSHLCQSNWEKLENSSLKAPFYFHRFFPHQPDLNYQTPEVLAEMTKTLAFWTKMGADGFRADAVSFLWKEEGSDCANLPQMHLVIAFFRAALDFLKPGTILLAEACQKPEEIIRYFGSPKMPECQAAYHFPLIPAIYKSLAEESPEAILKALSPQHTPAIENESQWFVFLRCHDELNFEMLSRDDYEPIHKMYCHDKRWNFRDGAGIAARLADLLDYNPQKINLAYSILLSLFGTPILFYGDEIAKTNDYDYYFQMKNLTGISDSRYWCRGNFNMTRVLSLLNNQNTIAAHVFNMVKNMLHARKAHPCFGSGNSEFISFYNSDNSINPHILAYSRQTNDNKILIINNLSKETQILTISSELAKSQSILTQKPNIRDKQAELPPYSFFWLKV